MIQTCLRAPEFESIVDFDHEGWVSCFGVALPKQYNVHII
jgi:hypothetical protein